KAGQNDQRGQAARHRQVMKGFGARRFGHVGGLVSGCRAELWHPSPISIARAIGKIADSTG
ncbi:hypothetical protein OY671_010403, partial [Metschnikowia pulcherrima]